MKKLVLAGMALTLSVALAACSSNGTDASINRLSAQLDETANTLSNVQTVNPTDLNISKESLESMVSADNAIYDNLIGTQSSLLNEEYYKMNILNKTAKIKNNLGKDLKLTKAQQSAVNDLTASLNKYTNSVSYTKNELSNTIRSISSLKKNVAKNSDKINAKLNRLICNSNTRACYYENILRTLDRIDSYLNCEDCGNNNSQTQTENETNNQTDSQARNQKNNSLVRNIDTYLPNGENVQNETTQPLYNSNQINRMAFPYGNGAYAPYGAYGNEQFRYGRFGYGNLPYNGNFYNYNNANLGGYQFNPNRNTDTYGPMMRNIDTYRATEQYTNAETERRLEDYEEIKDGTIQNVENKTEKKFQNKNKSFKGINETKANTSDMVIIPVENNTSSVTNNKTEEKTEVSISNSTNENRTEITTSNNSTQKEETKQNNTTNTTEDKAKDTTSNIIARQLERTEKKEVQSPATRQSLPNETAQSNTQTRRTTKPVSRADELKQPIVEHKTNAVSH